MTVASDFDYVQKMTPEGYTFPTHRLKTCEAGRTPLVLVACGSFSPITLLHLRLFPMARGWSNSRPLPRLPLRNNPPPLTILADHARNEGFDVVGAYLSPVGDGYKKKGLAPSFHRINMCEIAAENASKFLMVDRWEPENPTYIPTARVLDHFDWEMNHVRGGVERSDGSRVPAKIVLLAGADLIQTIMTPGVWDVADVDHILGNFGVFVLERTGTELDTALEQLKRWEKNIHVIRQVSHFPRVRCRCRVTAGKPKNKSD